MLRARPGGMRRAESPIPVLEAGRSSISDTRRSIAASRSRAACQRSIVAFLQYLMHESEPGVVAESDSIQASGRPAVVAESHALALRLDYRSDPSPMRTRRAFTRKIRIRESFTGGDRSDRESLAGIHSSTHAKDDTTVGSLRPGTAGSPLPSSRPGDGRRSRHGDPRTRKGRLTCPNMDDDPSLSGSEVVSAGPASVRVCRRQLGLPWSSVSGIPRSSSPSDDFGSAARETSALSGRAGTHQIVPGPPSASGAASSTGPRRVRDETWWTSGRNEIGHSTITSMSSLPHEWQ